MVGGGCEGRPSASGVLLTAKLAGTGGQVPVKPGGLGPAPRVSPGPNSAQPQCPACRQVGTKQTVPSRVSRAQRAGGIPWDPGVLGSCLGLPAPAPGGRRPP